jgi:hypothetical protein
VRLQGGPISLQHNLILASNPASAVHVLARHAMLP